MHTCVNILPNVFAAVSVQEAGDRPAGCNIYIYVYMYVCMYTYLRSVLTNIHVCIYCQMCSRPFLLQQGKVNPKFTPG